MDNKEYFKLYTEMRLLEDYLVEVLEQVKKVNQTLRALVIKPS